MPHWLQCATVCTRDTASGVGKEDRHRRHGRWAALAPALFWLPVARALVQRGQAPWRASPGRPRRRSRHGHRRAARCPGAGHWSVAPSSHSVHRWPSMGRLSYRSPRALAPHCLVEADTCEQRARHAHSRRRRRRPMTPAAETNRRAASHRGAQPLAASPQPALSSSRGVAHARSSVLARPVCMARCGAEWGQCTDQG